MRLVMIDNYDSFTFNLVQLFYEFDLEVLVYRHDQIAPAAMEQLRPDWICISPGPKDPAHAGISKEVVRHFARRIPILGVCLGMQVINEVFGGKTRKAPVPMHGKRCRVHHTGEGIFSNIQSPFWAARYHSLHIEMPVNCSSTSTGGSDGIVPLAHAPDGVIMGVQHRSWPLCGVQFHPESFLTEFGLDLVANFLALNPRYNVLNAPSIRTPDRFPRLGWSESWNDSAAPSALRKAL
ncbi:MAG: aminodeoxychorismate/anthranilate synthase component II [Desulforhabdus sp.]|nr:aminodeoxychorismate/anthranilate synthase component II [Desulforhabdus sp.]